MKERKDYLENSCYHIETHYCTRLQRGPQRESSVFQYGSIAQLGEQVLHTDKVRSSNLFTTTKGGQSDW